MIKSICDKIANKSDASCSRRYIETKTKSKNCKESKVGLDEENKTKTEIKSKKIKQIK